MKGIIEIIYILIRYGEKKIFWVILLNLFFIIATGCLEMITSYSLVSLGQFLSSKSLPSIIPAFNIFSNNPLNNLITLIIIASILGSIFKVYLIELQYKLSGLVGSKLSYFLTKSLLNKKWKINEKISDKSEYVTTCVTHIPNIVGVTNHFITMLSSLVFVIGLIYGLIISSPEITIIMMLVIGFYYLLSILLIRKPLINISKIIAQSLRLVQQIHSEIYEIRREISISSREKDWSESVYKRFFKLTLAQKKSGLLSDSPRILIEMLVILSISIIILLNSNSNYIINILAVIFIIIQKVMPNVQKIFSSISIGMAYRGGIDKVISALNSISNYAENAVKDNKESYLAKCKTLEISFKSNKNSLKNKGNIILERGTITCLIGNSGSGKTTLINQIFEDPNSKNISFRDATNKNLISSNLIIASSTFVPQSPYLITGSIEDNILLNPPNYVKKDLRKIDQEIYDNSLIHDLIENLKFTTISNETSERGLSGGQIQRISIARALQNNSEIIFLDEPTSALDNKTSEKIIKNISDYLSNNFILLITHETKLLKFAKRIYKLDEDKLFRI